MNIRISTEQPITARVKRRQYDIEPDRLFDLAYLVILKSNAEIEYSDTESRIISTRLTGMSKINVSVESNSVIRVNIFNAYTTTAYERFFNLLEKYINQSEQ